ncbi:MAG: hypothetical protein ACR2NC_04665 [Thermodesulfobacteriota bacterium]
MEELITNREDDLNNGIQHDITKIAAECGLAFTVFTSASVWDQWITPDSEAVKKGETENNRIQLILQKLIYEIRVYRQEGRSNIMKFDVDLTKEGKSVNADLVSVLGPVSMDNGSPCITLLLESELKKNEDQSS